MNKKLNELIKLAQGEISQNNFESKCGLGSGTLTRIISGERYPKPDTLKKISDAAHNNVTYTDLMLAAGYIKNETIFESKLAKRLKALREEDNLSKNELSRILGIDYSLYCNLESGAYSPNIVILKSLAELYNVCVDYILGSTDKRRHWKPDAPTSKRSVKIELPYYDNPASAGVGEYLLTGGYDFEVREFENVPQNASFAVRIKGNSMEPKYYDNDIVFVRQGVVVRDGQIGIFLLNEESYLKELSGRFLVSLNSDYPPKEIGEFDSFYILGRVVGKVEK